MNKLQEHKLSVLYELFQKDSGLQICQQMTTSRLKIHQWPKRQVFSFSFFLYDVQLFVLYHALQIIV